MTSSPRGKTKPEIQGFPPKWLSKVPEADLARSRGDEVADFAEALSRSQKIPLLVMPVSHLDFADGKENLPDNSLR